ncbi:MAG: 30S ribosomal protein S20 [Candidatus Saccharibacteria bacterium]
MPVIKSAIKRAKQEKKRKAYNVSVKSSVKLKFKAVRDELATGKVKSNEDLIAAIKEIDRAVRKGVIKKQAAARKKSRLTKSYNSVASKPFGSENPSKPGTKKAAAKKPAAKKVATKKPAAKKTAAKKPTPTKKSAK